MDIKITYVYAIKKREDVRLSDMIIGPDPNGEYLFDSRYIMFVGTDEAEKPYLLDQRGNCSPAPESFWFEEEDVIEEGESLKQVLRKLDRRIQKRLVWAGDGWDRICLGIR